MKVSSIEGDEEQCINIGRRETPALTNRLSDSAVGQLVQKPSIMKL
jgi:hypothetical protein